MAGYRQEVLQRLWLLSWMRMGALGLFCALVRVGVPADNDRSSADVHAFDVLVLDAVMVFVSVDYTVFVLHIPARVADGFQSCPYRRPFSCFGDNSWSFGV